MVPCLYHIVEQQVAPKSHSKCLTWTRRRMPKDLVYLFPLHAASTNSSFLQASTEPLRFLCATMSNLMIQSPLHFLFLMHTSVLSFFFCSLLSFWFFSCVPFSCMFKNKLIALLYSHGTSSSRLILVIYKIV